MVEAAESSIKEWKPFKAEWSLQGPVVTAMIDALEDGHADDPIKQLAAIVENKIGRTSLFEACSIVRDFMNRRYGSVDEGAFSQFLVDLKKQREYLAAADKLPLLGMMSQELYADMLRAHDDWKESLKPSAEA